MRNLINLLIFLIVLPGCAKPENKSKVLAGDQQTLEAAKKLLTSEGYFENNICRSLVKENSLSLRFSTNRTTLAATTDQPEGKFVPWFDFGINKIDNALSTKPLFKSIYYPGFFNSITPGGKADVRSFDSPMTNGFETSQTSWDVQRYFQDVCLMTFGNSELKIPSLEKKYSIVEAAHTEFKLDLNEHGYPVAGFKPLIINNVTELTLNATRKGELAEMHDLLILRFSKESGLFSVKMSIGQGTTKPNNVNVKRYDYEVVVDNRQDYSSTIK